MKLTAHRLFQYLFLLPVLQARAGELRVDLSEPLGPATHRASGMLWSLSADRPADEWVVPLKFQYFRSRLTPWIYYSGIDSLARMDQLGAKLQVVLSDEYALQFQKIHRKTADNDGFGYWNVTDWPGENGNFELWDKVIQNCYDRVKDRGLVVEWDIWEEPNFHGWWKPSREQFFETYAHACRKLRALDPEAVIVGPSINRYDEDYLEAFLLYAKRHNVLPDVLSWHEIMNHHPPASIPDHVNEIRTFMRRKGIDVPKIVINELVSPNRQTSPGEHVWYFAAIEEAKVDGACRAGWLEQDNSIFNAWRPMLAGLLTPDLEPRSTWWACKYYADITGTLVQVKPDSSMTGIAGIDPEKGVVQILLGCSRHHAEQMNLKVLNLRKAPFVSKLGKVHVTAHYLPHSGLNALPAPKPFFDEVLRVNYGYLQVPLPGLGPNEAAFITLKRP
jgi:hypothetical protein